MVFLVKFVGLLIMTFGFAIFVSPQFVQKMFDFFKAGKRWEECQPMPDIGPGGVSD
ncbi:MAG: hypothetical protein Q8Q08_06810 [Candidatus Omnitrophota bacterium]|nr:hypothetical protein [Candidatus Omnitrophota bacterium]